MSEHNDKSEQEAGEELCVKYRESDSTQYCLHSTTTQKCLSNTIVLQSFLSNNKIRMGKKFWPHLLDSLHNTTSIFTTKNIHNYINIYKTVAINILFLISVILATTACNDNVKLSTNFIQRIKNINSYSTINKGSFIVFLPNRDQISIKTNHNFLIKKTEITNYNWIFYTGKKPDNKCGLLCAMINIDFIDAIVFTNSMSEKEGFEKCYKIFEDRVIWSKGYSCKGYRIPTLIEWLSASGELTKAIFEDKDISDYAELKLNLGPPKISFKKANNLGVFDMVGGLEEILWDEFEEFDGDQIDRIKNILKKDINYNKKQVRLTFNKMFQSHIIIGCNYWHSLDGCIREFFQRRYSSIVYEKNSVMSGLRVVRTVP